MTVDYSGSGLDGGSWSCWLLTRDYDASGLGSVELVWFESLRRTRVFRDPQDPLSSSDELLKDLDCPQRMNLCQLLEPNRTSLTSKALPVPQTASASLTDSSCHQNTKSSETVCVLRDSVSSETVCPQRQSVSSETVCPQRHCVSPETVCPQRQCVPRDSLCPQRQSVSPVLGQSPAGGPPDTGAERNKGLLNFGRENILLQAQESPPGGGKMSWGFPRNPCSLRQPLFIPEEEKKLNSIPRTREVRSIRPSTDLRCNHETDRSPA
ncbi:unnamed protein product [Pleuronectes platessa]|uniref:Uncharacterized protein n=1 Tax=Pleuronectes platessa TaxID=8262 RepID=A0A9N7Y6L1_PLEPL|nr:unnamed protein product [Pleuronectes platessa]